MLGKHESRLHQVSVYLFVFLVGVQVETVMSEIDIFCFLNEYHHFRPHEEVEEQYVRWKHRTL